MATYDAGIVTAYGAAVHGGYTGTYEQFCAQQANYAQSAAAVEQAKEDVQELVDDIPEDYSQLSEDVGDLDDRVTALEEGGSGSGLTDDIKQALLQIAEKIAYIDEDGQDYYDDLYNALYPTAELVSISAVYTQSGTVYDTDSLDSLKDDLVVTANMSDSTTRTVTAYTLSGTLTEGTSTITVTYSGKTTTFTVTVTRLEIKVFKGKGTGGSDYTSIVDNPNRALSEVIDLTGATEIVTQWDYSETQDAIKFAVGDTSVESTGNVLVPESYLGTGHTVSPYDAWRTTSENLYVAERSSNKWVTLLPRSGKIRITFRNVANPNTAIGTISGIYTINGKKYHLVEENGNLLV